MLSAPPALWDSKLEASASGLGPIFAASEAPAIDGQTTNDDGLQLVASFLHEPVHAEHQLSLIGSACGSGHDQLPLIDESLFDLVGIPELEDVEDRFDECGDSSPARSACHHLLFDEIPALEDVPDEEVNWPSWTSDSPPDSITPAASQVKLEQDDDRLSSRSGPIGSTQVIPPQIVFEDDDCCLPVAGLEEEVQASSPATNDLSGYADSSVGCASPASVYSIGYGTSTSSGIGGSSPFSGGFTSTDDLAALSPAEKRRRISQVSVSSFCSSIGGTESIGSPTSSTSGAASDSDHSTGRKIRVTRVGGGGGGGRRSRFTPEDRKERKKAQNRTAAERYRQKRRQAEETISEEEQQLMDANGELRVEVTKLEAEVSCLKRLMREMLLARGIEIPAPPPKKKSKTS